MIKSVKIIVALLLFVAGSFSSVSSQQYDPLYTQYMFNSLAINPAYAGTSGVLNAMLMSRLQWIGIEDAPKTQTLSFHTPVASRNIGAGLSIIHDIISPVTNTNISTDYSYNFKLNQEFRMSLGLKVSISSFKRDLSKFYDDEDISRDPLYSNPVDKKVLPNFGFGAYCYSSKYYFGAAIPRLVENILSDDGSVSSVNKDKMNRLYMVMGGGVFPVGSYVILKPSFILRASGSAPLSYDLNVNALIKEKLWAGLMLRPKEAFGTLIQLQLSNQMRIGYAFEMMTNKLMSHHRGTHEIMISYDFIFKKENIQNPRYF